MGVIQKQSLNYTLVHLVGVLIGMVSTLLIYPLNREAYGLGRFLIDFSILLYPFILLGFDGLAIRYFPDFKDASNKHKGFLSFLLGGLLVGCISLSLISWIWGWDILHFLENTTGMQFGSTELIRKYMWVAIPTICFMSAAWLFNQYCTNFHKILFPAIFQNLIKITLPILILLVYYDYMGIDIIAYGVMFHFLLIALLYALYVYLIGELKLGIQTAYYRKPLLKGMMNYAFFSLFGSIGTLIAFRIDSIMVSTLIGLEYNGDFGIASTIAHTIAIPTNAVLAISAPVIAAAWADNETSRIESVYRKSSINLLIPGALIYVGMWACIDHLFDWMPNGDAITQGKWIVLILGFAKIIDMATSVNNEIIAYSRYYRFNFVAVLLLAICNIGFNFYFISLYGIIGAAFATALSIMLYNLAKFLFIYIRLGMQPFSIQTVKIIGISLVSYAAVFWWPDLGHPLLNIAAKSASITLLFISLTRIMNISAEFNELLEKYLLKYIK